MVVLAGRRRMKRLSVSFLAALGVLLIGCTPSHPQSTFDPLGPVAESQLDLWLHELQEILWLLEDALVEAEPTEEFLARFLTKTFD